jgi:SET domain-containing protein
MKYRVETSPQHGRGVFAAAPIAAGEAIMRFTGPLREPPDVDFDDYHLQIGEHRYLGPSGQADDYVNHSCAPNCALRDGLTLTALRDILPGEELTWDYSTAIDEADFAGFPCACGAPGCRGAVRSFRDLPAADRARLRPWLLPYLRAKYFAD